ncbi:MAG TPA: alpha/beta hydrolase [Candidatus Brocadiia bacterium]|nr:alpha/beta hydrolase [Candidatus Brocadiia bacterium]
MNKDKYCICLVLLVFSVVTLFPQSAHAQRAAPRKETSETNEELRKTLDDFPQADKNGDGVLTRKEATQFRKRHSGRRAGLDALKAISVEPTYADVRYGDHPRNQLDFWKAKSDKPSPLIICIHGGGFTGGDKKMFAQFVPLVLAQGFSVMTINYRFVKGPDSEPFPGPMKDGVRALQFARANAKEWGIDPTRVGLTGGSAGGCMSCWIAMHDDMANPDSNDPVERQSTRVSCVVALGAQTSLDPQLMFAKIGGDPSMHPVLLPFFGARTIEDLAKPEFRKIIEEASPINYATEDDPPMMLSYKGVLDDVPLPPDTPIGKSIHHPMFGKVLKDKLDSLGVECHFHYTGSPVTVQDHIAFLKKHLGTK